MTWVDEVKELVPEYAKDIKLNLDAVINRSTVDYDYASSLALAAALATGNQDIVSQLLTMSGGDLSKFAQSQKGTTAAPTTTAPMDIKSTSDFQIVKKANPNATDIEIENFLKQKFPNKYK